MVNPASSADIVLLWEQRVSKERQSPIDTLPSFISLFGWERHYTQCGPSQFTWRAVLLKAMPPYIIYMYIYSMPETLAYIFKSCWWYILGMNCIRVAWKNKKKPSLWDKKQNKMAHLLNHEGIRYDPLSRYHLGLIAVALKEIKKYFLLERTSEESI